VLLALTREWYELISLDLTIRRSLSEWPTPGKSDAAAKIAPFIELVFGEGANVPEEALDFAVLAELIFVAAESLHCVECWGE